MKYYRQYIDQDNPEEITLETALSVLIDNYPGMTRNQIQEELEKLAGEKIFHSVSALYWAEN